MDSSRTLAEQLVERLIRDDDKFLQGLGMTVAESGGLCWPGGRLWIHTDFGPLGQDKDCNQDYALAWRASDAVKSAVNWIVAVADGLTSSFRSEWGSRLACWSGVAGLLKSGASALPQQRLRSALDAVVDRIGAVADTLRHDDGLSRPADLFPATWRYILRDGLLLQTTLTLAWCELGTVYVAIVGDGGACRRLRCDPTMDQYEVLSAPPLNTERVHALGPRNAAAIEPDSWHKLPLCSVSQLAIYTDGLVRSATTDGAELLTELKTMMHAGAANPVRELVSEKLRDGTDSFSDNLTLAWIVLD